MISGIGWLFGVLLFGATICFWVFGEFDVWYQIATALGISVAIVILPGWLTEFIVGNALVGARAGKSDIFVI